MHQIAKRASEIGWSASPVRYLLNIKHWEIISCAKSEAVLLLLFFLVFSVKPSKDLNVFKRSDSSRLPFGIAILLFGFHEQSGNVISFSRKKPVV